MRSRIRRGSTSSRRRRSKCTSATRRVHRETASTSAMSNLCGGWKVTFVALKKCLVPVNHSGNRSYLGERSWGRCIAWVSLRESTQLLVSTTEPSVQNLPQRPHATERGVFQVIEEPGCAYRHLVHLTLNFNFVHPRARVLVLGPSGPAAHTTPCWVVWLYPEQ